MTEDKDTGKMTEEKAKIVKIKGNQIKKKTRDSTIEGKITEKMIEGKVKEEMIEGRVKGNMIKDKTKGRERINPSISVRLNSIDKKDLTKEETAIVIMRYLVDEEQFIHYH
jgi:hypothetical protein